MRDWYLALLALVCACPGAALAGSEIPPWPSQAAQAQTPIQFIPAEVDLGEHPVGQKGVIRRVTVRNSGGGRTRLSSWSVVGDVSIDSDCGSELDSGAQCELRLRFAPLAPGLRRASVMVLDEARGSLVSLGVSGRGVPPVESALASRTASVRQRGAPSNSGRGRHQPAARLKRQTKKSTASRQRLEANTAA
ncbi:MAG: hypothetical protein HYZ17_00090 [Betaproteobacteria bacterium]|nr:hypothetical protein [Betaproteobacteria bacterium]